MKARPKKNGVAFLKKPLPRAKTSNSVYTVVPYGKGSFALARVTKNGTITGGRVEILEDWATHSTRESAIAEAVYQNSRLGKLYYHLLFVVEGNAHDEAHQIAKKLRDFSLDDLTRLREGKEVSIPKGMSKPAGDYARAWRHADTLRKLAEDIRARLWRG
jgi:hypothetical protein